MPSKQTSARSSPGDALTKTYSINDARNLLLLLRLNPRPWRAQLPGNKRTGRSIAAIFAHFHNNRLSWFKNSAPHLNCPSPLDPACCTIERASAAHKKNAIPCLPMLADALPDDAQRRVPRFHRGQILMLAHQLGYQPPDEAAYGVWQWDKLWKQVK